MLKIGRATLNNYTQLELAVSREVYMRQPTQLKLLHSPCYKILLQPKALFCSSQNADLSIAPMTISSDRQTVLDFTQPYMTFGLAYMMRVKDVDANYFRFLSPFHKDLWVAIGVLVMVMSLLLWICSVFSPWGYYGRCLQARSPKEVVLHKQTICS